MLLMPSSAASDALPPSPCRSGSCRRRAHISSKWQAQLVDMPPCTPRAQGAIIIQSVYLTRSDLVYLVVGQRGENADYGGGGGASTPVMLCPLHARSP
jgi:hypothetical protein